MGKIPAKRHHGVKDPIKQNERRNAVIKMKINEAPSNIEQQEIPKKLRNLFRPVKKIRAGIDDPKFVIDTKGKAVVAGNPEMKARPVKKVPKVERKPGESDRELLWRAEKTSRQYFKKVKFENKYDVDLETDDETGEVKVKKRDKTFEEEELKHAKPTTKWQAKKLKKVEKLQAERNERKKARLEKFKERKLWKKNKNKDEFSVLKQDKVEFGDVAHQPPAITAKPRKSSDVGRVPSIYMITVS